MPWVSGAGRAGFWLLGFLVACVGGRGRRCMLGSEALACFLRSLSARAKLPSLSPWWRRRSLMSCWAPLSPSSEMLVAVRLSHKDGTNIWRQLLLHPLALLLLLLLPLLVQEDLLL